MREFLAFPFRVLEVIALILAIVALVAGAVVLAPIGALVVLTRAAGDYVEGKVPR